MLTQPLLMAALISAPAWAQAGQPTDDADALAQTQKLLNDPAQRAEAIKQNADAARTDQNLQKMMGSGAAADEVYALSAQVMDKLVRDAQGDPAKMQKLLEDAGRNPAAFAEGWDDASRAKLRGIAGRLESQQRAKP